jgi:hypothetical protein
MNKGTNKTSFLTKRDLKLNSRFYTIFFSHQLFPLPAFGVHSLAFEHGLAEVSTLVYFAGLTLSVRHYKRPSVSTSRSAAGWLCNELWLTQ